MNTCRHYQRRRRRRRRDSTQSRGLPDLATRRLPALGVLLHTSPAYRGDATTQPLAARRQLIYLVVLTMAVISPAIWAARGGLERGHLRDTGAAAIPAWGHRDRGNSTGFVVPIALGLLRGVVPTAVGPRHHHDLGPGSRSSSFGVVLPRLTMAVGWYRDHRQKPVV